MHNLTKIKIFRVLLWISYPLSVILFYPIILFRSKQKSNLFFFFDRYAIGGAQKVHLDILESVKDIEKIVYFTRYSPNDKLKKDFYEFENTKCLDIHFWCDNLLLRLFTVHYYAFLLNRHDNAVVLSSNSTFFYDMLPFLKKSIKTIELLHNFSYGKKGMEFFGLANHKYLDKRMVIDEITRQNILTQYGEYKIDKKFNERVELVEFGVFVPVKPVKTQSPVLKVLYAGRGTAQKRVWLVNQIAEYFIHNSKQIEFLFAGPLEGELSELVKNKSKVYGEIGDVNMMQELFKEAHVIILTSAFEGFPVVIKEGMANGCVPVATALPGNKTHLANKVNALLMETPEEEKKVVQQGIDHINFLLNNPSYLRELSENAYNYAKKSFEKDYFLKRYRELLL
jgi:glycosyltransferase involved in cell wall biosynthesis